MPVATRTTAIRRPLVALLLLVCSGLLSHASAQCLPRAFDADEESVIDIYLAYYGRPPDAAGLAYWSRRLQAEGNSLESIIDAFGTSAEFDARFGDMDNAQLVTNLYFQMFGRDPEPIGLAYYMGRLTAGTSSLPRITLDILYGARNEDRRVLENRAHVARDFVTRLEQQGRNYADAAMLLCHAQVETQTLDAICLAGERIATGPAEDDLIYPLTGINIGPYICPERDYRTGAITPQDPAAGRDMRMRRGQMDALVGTLAPRGQWLRTFGCTFGLNDMARRAKAQGRKVALGAWIDADAATNQAEVDCVIEAARKGWADLLIIGTEVLYRGELSVDEVVALIEQVKDQTDRPVTYAALYGAYLQHPALVDAVDLILANIYPYWEGVAVDAAVCTLAERYRSLADAAADKPVWIGETGWPSAGDSVGGAIPSDENAARYFQEFVSWARAERIHYFYFEGMDEPWKVRTEGASGAHWGIRDKFGAMKPGYSAVFNGATVPVACASGDPRIELTHVPPRGSYENLRGQVSNVSPADAAVAVYIKVNGRWWTKPTFAAPLTVIAPNGHWVCDITTGGSDRTATDIAAFLVPRTYAPPRRGGEAALPPEIYDAALDWIEVSRLP